jgi:hypothetical protein
MDEPNENPRCSMPMRRPIQKRGIWHTGRRAWNICLRRLRKRGGKLGNGQQAGLSLHIRSQQGLRESQSASGAVTHFFVAEHCPRTSVRGLRRCYNRRAADMACCDCPPDDGWTSVFEVIKADLNWESRTTTRLRVRAFITRAVRVDRSPLRAAIHHDHGQSAVRNPYGRRRAASPTALSGHIGSLSDPI